MRGKHQMVTFQARLHSYGCAIHEGPDLVLNPGERLVGDWSDEARTIDWPRGQRQPRAWFNYPANAKRVRTRLLLIENETCRTHAPAVELIQWSRWKGRDDRWPEACMNLGVAGLCTPRKIPGGSVCWELSTMNCVWFGKSIGMKSQSWLGMTGVARACPTIGRAMGLMSFARCRTCPWKSVMKTTAWTKQMGATIGSGVRYSTEVARL
ncbi:hypothetical protein DFH09DRAFT_1165378 [Mycena vulgaris]|nr:hypothetical protein DFH09DRAFT_1165378 [Mycena vulgaris]